MTYDTEPLPEIEWTLRDGTREVIGYDCRRATCRFRGRDYEAWYTEELPLATGPWKFHGLPGLILKASDSRQHYTFVCTGIEKAGKEEAILFIGSEYEPISRKDLLRIHERFAADPIGYLKETSPGMG